MLEKMPTWGFAALVCAIVPACMTIVQATKAPKPVLAERCPSPADAQQVLDHWTDLGVVQKLRRNGGTDAVLEVRKDQWADIGRDRQLSLALSAYCLVADANGNGMVQVEGGLQEDLGAIVDGNWMR